jgi:hypothetical protein
LCWSFCLNCPSFLCLSNAQTPQKAQIPPYARVQIFVTSLVYSFIYSLIHSIFVKPFVCSVHMVPGDKQSVIKLAPSLPSRVYIPLGALNMKQKHHRSQVPTDHRCVPQTVTCMAEGVCACRVRKPQSRLVASPNLSILSPFFFIANASHHSLAPLISDCLSPGVCLSVWPSICLLLSLLIVTFPSVYGKEGSFFFGLFFIDTTCQATPLYLGASGTDQVSGYLQMFCHTASCSEALFFFK